MSQTKAREGLVESTKGRTKDKKEDITQYGSTVYIGIAMHMFYPH